jgi:mannose-6-phosphate isomerase-like protein (cupin superfamily)
MEIWYVNTEKYCGKKLVIVEGSSTSLHYHKIKDETMFVDHGKLRIEWGNDKDPTLLCPGECIRIEPGTAHRLIAESGYGPLSLIEFSTHHEDSDSYRIEL